MGFCLGDGLTSMGLRPSHKIGGRSVLGITKVITGHFGAALWCLLFLQR
jgi:hypothetical protein